jgi:hypothetical protein
MFGTLDENLKNPTNGNDGNIVLTYVNSNEGIHR